ncbi:MAG: class I tRNA ligase family protein [Candidatus Niyogibacteria bacterium]|nr:class I tRNA ligase family protein [Candidatus Niyogibacteria bacterium]
MTTSNGVKNNLDKPYNPKEVEDKIYQIWEKSGFFNPDNLPVSSVSGGKNFCIIMPPPNANGSLHIGHAVFVALQDIMIRYRRMKGDKALWLPGADHAGFETQVVYDKKLEKEGRSRFRIPADQLWQEMRNFTQINKKTMENQLRKLGASCDWSREKFTLDKDIVEIVYQTFEKLKKDGLLYKGKRIVNWCVKHQTSLSEVEIKHQERENPLYYIKYGPLELATVRLETKFGDTAVAVNPKDKRYRKYIGQEIEIETVLGKSKIKIIADEAVDMKFGTGAIKVTPAHDPADFEIWQRHKNEMPEPKQVIDRFGKMNELAGPYRGLKTMEARKRIEEDMIKKGVLDPSKTDHHYKHNVATCYKCGTVIEPLILDNQWFVKMTEKPRAGGISLRDAAVKAVKSGKIKFIPKRFEKIFFHWMKNIKDWNISRQIVWGIKIPDETTTDVFDTWFSSGQWPFASLMAAKKNDFKTFYPTDVMETAWDILFFWVARMIMLGIYATGKIPFKTVYLHGLVRDKDRQKMSKSKGNVINPLGVVDIYGADALRMALVIGNTPGNDPIIYEEKIRGYRNFANKIWQASRFVLMNLDGFDPKTKPKLAPADKKRLKEISQLKKEITKLMESFKFYAAAEKLYHYFWHIFADKIIESTKARLRENKESRQAAQHLLLEILKINLKLFHPFMPFITEEIWSKLPIKNKKLLMIEQWPKK